MLEYLDIFDQVGIYIIFINASGFDIILTQSELVDFYVWFGHKIFFIPLAHPKFSPSLRCWVCCHVYLTNQLLPARESEALS